MSDLVVLVPVLGRPHRVRPLLESLEATTSARVLFLADAGDEAECAAIRRERKRSPLRIDVDTGGGNYARKINRGVGLTREPLIFLGADDLEFLPGWLDAAKARLGQVVGVNDLCNPRTLKGLHATHFLITREYAERPTIGKKPGPLCEVYAHNCTDDELIAVAKKRSVYAFASDSHVKHLHPMAGHPSDPTYEKGTSSLRNDRRLFIRRRRRLFA